MVMLPNKQFVQYLAGETISTVGRSWLPAKDLANQNLGIFFNKSRVKMTVNMIDTTG